MALGGDLDTVLKKMYRIRGETKQVVQRAESSSTLRSPRPAGPNCSHVASHRPSPLSSEQNQRLGGFILMLPYWRWPGMW
jgi:hypothetical protein